MTITPQTYDVTVTREGEWWLADVRSVSGAHTHAKTLAGLARSTREVIVLMDDLPLNARDCIHLEFDLQLAKPLTDALREAREAREGSDAARTRAIETTRKAIAEIEAGIPNTSVGDIARMLGISPQRVHQLRQ